MDVREISQPTFGQGIVVSAGSALAVFVLSFLAYGDKTDHDVPATATTNLLFWFLAVIVIVLSGWGAQFAERSAAAAAAAVGHSRPQATVASAWAVPAVAVFAAVMLVATYHNRWMFAIGPVVAFFGTAGSLLSRDLLDDAGDTTHRAATTVHTLVIHVTAFLALGMVYYNKLPLWLGLPLVAAIAGVLVLETLERASIPAIRRVGYSIIGGFVVAEALIAVNWWPTHGWTGGAVLLVTFYLTAGVILARAQRASVRSRDLVEFGLVSLVAIIILAAAA